MPFNCFPLAPLEHFTLFKGVGSEQHCPLLDWFPKSKLDSQPFFRTSLLKVLFASFWGQEAVVSRNLEIPTFLNSLLSVSFLLVNWPNLFWAYRYFVRCNQWKLPYRVNDLFFKSVSWKLWISRYTVCLLNHHSHRFASILPLVTWVSFDSLQ